MITQVPASTGAAVSPNTSSAFPVLDLTKAPIRSFIYAKTNIGGWFFDAILQASHTSTLTITSHPIQAGSNVTDNAFLQPRTLSFNIGMSDVTKSFIPGQFAGGSSRSEQAYEVLKQLQQLRIPVQVYTRRGLYQNMLVETLTVQDDNTTAHGLRVTVDLQELLVATVQVVKISSNPGVTDKAKKGKQQPKQIPNSLAKEIGKLLNGIGL